MKRPILLLLAMIVAAGAAQDTNTIPVFTIGAETYKNARISSVSGAYAILIFDGGGKRVLMSDLPEAIQKQYGYDPAKADQALADEKAAREALAAQQAAQQQTLLTNPDRQKLTIIKTFGTSSPVKCTASVDGAEKDLYLDYIPYPLKVSFDKMREMEASIQAQEKQLQAEQSAASHQNSNPSAQPKRRRRNNAQGNNGSQTPANAQNTPDPAYIKDQKDEIEKLKAQLESLKAKNQKLALIYAVATRGVYAGLPYWKYAGPAAE